MARLRTKTNEDQVLADVGRFVRAVREVAAPRTANKLRDQAQVAGFREIADIYQIGPRTMERYAAVTVATAQNPEASIKVKGRGFPLSEFKPVQTSKGVSVLVKGRRVIVEEAFMPKRFGRHVFARGGYGGKGGIVPTGKSFGRFQYGRRRLPIQELFTFGPVEAFSNPKVTAAMIKRCEEQKDAVFQAEVRAVRRGF